MLYLIYMASFKQFWHRMYLRINSSLSAINGYMYGNQEGLEMCRGNTVSWHLIGLGSEVDIHGIYFSGNTLLIQGKRQDTANLFPHSSVTAVMKPDSEGESRKPYLLTGNSWYCSELMMVYIHFSTSCVFQAEVRKC